MTKHPQNYWLNAQTAVFRCTCVLFVCTFTGFDTNLISFPTTSSSFFSFAVLVPLTRSVYKPATRILSLQSEIEKQRNNPQDNNCPPTNQPTDRPWQYSLTWYKKYNQATQENTTALCFFRGTLDSFTQSEGGPVFEQRWIDGKMNEWTRGCQD